MYTIDESKLDPGIVEVVKWLWIHNFKVCDSGDGRTKPEASRHFDYPHIFIPIDTYSIRSEADRLLSIIGRLCPDAKGVSVEAIYDPQSKLALLGLYKFSDADLAARKVFT